LIRLNFGLDHGEPDSDFSIGGFGLGFGDPLFTFFSNHGLGIGESGNTFFSNQGLVCGESVIPVVSPKIFGPILGDAIFDAKDSGKI
jgi:hypothetical protein